MAIISPSFMIEAYSQGYFPMGMEGSDHEVNWYSARRRGVIPLDQFHIPTRVLRVIRSKKYTVGLNKNFIAVVEGCASRESTWINSTIKDTFTHLNSVGLAHSVEVWRDDTLCGGLYGIALGGAFFAESVYQSEPECMKIALHFCHQLLIERGFLLWDVQFLNPFLAQFGCIELTPKKYMKLLDEALGMNTTIVALES
jgi:leucyl/phenylalanyl-tRNA--protein transferase